MGSKAKQSKGSVGVESYQGRLRLRLPRQLFDGKQKYLTLGLPDSKVNRRLAEAKKALIEEDILKERFDYSLDKYRNQQERSHRQSHSQTSNHNLVEELQRRIKDNFNHADKTILSLLLQWQGPITSPDEASEFVSWIRSTRHPAPTTLQRYLNTLKKIDPDNFRHIKIKVEKKGIPVAYTDEQVRAILQFLQKSRYYSYYHDFVKFFLYTGCRTSEAIALRWKHVHLRRREIHFCISLAENEDGSLREKGTKTGKPRVFPLNSELLAMLQERANQDPEPDSLVFPAKEGGYINRRDFVRRCWRACLKAAGIDYVPRETTQYKTRHTAISHSLEAGVNPVAVASLVGHDVRTLYENYASVIDRVELPPLY